MLDTATNRSDIPLAVTIGEPAGIGPDLILMAWQARREQGLAPFFVSGDVDFLVRRAKALQFDIAIEACEATDAGAVFKRALPVVSLNQVISGEPGQPAGSDSAAVIASIDAAVRAVRDGVARAVVTSPIHKKTLYLAGFDHPGHTEYLGVLSERMFQVPATPIMMLAGPELRTVPVTVHIPLRAVPETLTSEMIVAAGRIVARDLVTRFAVANPRLSVTGLNPHAGESGSLGTEDETIVAPAIAALRAEGIDARGPYPADAVFSARARPTYDAVLAMYHDQALIPVKTLAFDETVNVTLGLPFVRTSPDHGTAFDLAATGRARPESFLASLKLADRMTADARLPAGRDG